jgi:two-component system sensor histidine kinase/response regulator
MSDTVRILVIDDDQVDRASVRRALGRSEIAFEFVEAADGRVGLDLARDQAFDCILLDYRLPDIDAVEVLEGLLGGDGGNHAVIVLTGEADPEVALQMMRAGALDYLSKAELTPSTLTRSIRYARARREFLAELESARRLAEEKTRELQVLNDQKDLLFSIIAHDLRNPFQGLLGLSELQRKAAQRQDMAAMVRYADGLNQSAARASALMEGLFSWASLQLTTTQVSADCVDLRQVVDETFATIAEAAGKKQLAMHNRCAQAVAFADKDMIATVLRNLLNNAIKFSHPGGGIEVSATPYADRVEVAVADEGVGIPEAAIEDLFRMDRRSTTPGTQGEAGSGLGLLICRNLVERQGGVLSVATKLGQGTTFRFTLPLPPPDQAAGPKQDGHMVAAS